MSYTENLQTIIGRWKLQHKLAFIGIIILFLLPFAITEYLAFLAGQYMLFGLLALSLGLIWGYAGILSFGQAAFFGLGAYIMALSFDYISIINPAYAAIVITIIVTSLLAFAIGWFYFYANVHDVYFVIITLALPVIFEQLATTFSSITGGFEGTFVTRMAITLPGFELPLQNERLFYYVILCTLLLGYAVCLRCVKSHFGRILIAIRENEERTQSLGYDTAWYKTIAFSLSGTLAGVAGALYATLAGFVSPTVIGFLLSTEVVIWVALGGRELLLGAIIGGIVVSGLSTALSSAFPQIYILILGIIFIIVVVAFPKGIVGYLVEYVNNRRNSE